MKISSSEATWNNKSQLDNARQAIYKKGFLVTLDNFSQWQTQLHKEERIKELWKSNSRYYLTKINDTKVPTKLHDAVTNKAGIYMFTNKVNKKSYIGKSKNLCKRLYDYYWLAISDQMFSHSNMQRAFGRFGASNFKLTIIENCEEAILSEREQFYIDILKPQYNVRTTVKAKLKESKT